MNLVLPKRMANARKEQAAAKEFIVKASEIAAQEGVEIVGIQEGMELMKDSRFREAIALAQRYEGHEKAVSQLHREQMRPDSLDAKVFKHNQKLGETLIQNHKDGKYVEKD